jgi:DNA-binding Lrp family transcriptional regulator
MTKLSPGTVDESLLALLQRNARMPIAELARRLGVARSTAQGRLTRLEQRGVIRGYRLELAPAAVARRVQAHVMISVEPQQQAAVERKLRAMPAVTALLTVSGNFDLIAMLAADSTEALDAALDELREGRGVQSTVTSVVLSQRFAR